MSLTAAEVEQIVRLVEESSFDELILELDGTKLTLRRESDGRSVRSVPSETPGEAPPAVVPMASLVPGARASVATPADPTLHEVTAPLLGTFYRSPKPGAPPFVEVGSSVAEDTIVAIIEVMKLMNTVRAGVSGVVIDVLVADGVLADYGQPLMRVRKPG